MKKYVLGLVAAIMVIGFSAFTLTNKKSKDATMQTYTWHKYNAAGTAELVPAVTFTGTAAGAKSAFGCPDGSTVNCARGYDSEGNPTAEYVKKSPQ